MEFRILTRISFNKDHANNLLKNELQCFKAMNRHQTSLPFQHNRVKIQCMEHHSKVRLSMLVGDKIDEASALKMTKSISERRPPPLIKN